MVGIVRQKMLPVVLLIMLLGFAVTTSAQTETATPQPTQRPSPLRPIIPREEAIIRAGPGHTHSQLDRLRWADEIDIIARNRIGNWVKIRVERGNTDVEGWIVTGYLALYESIRLSEVPVDDSLPDADPSKVNSRSQAALYAVDVLPDISDAMREVYERGLEAGNHPEVITKIGDSLSASERYLTLMHLTGHELGPYDFLAPTVEFFGPSMAQASVASEIGLSTYGVFDPMWADDEFCEANESPLDCELRRKQPSVVFILFGPNDVRAMTGEAYADQMRMMVEACLDHGTIPVLSTFSADPDEEFWWQSIGFNQVLLDLATEYEVPLINLWAAARILPDYGLDRDQVHLKHSGYEMLHFRAGQEAYYGVSLQNLLALATLDELRRELGMDE